MVELKTADELAVMREAGRVVATALAACRDKAAVGVSLLELDSIAADVLTSMGATSSFQHYHPHFAPTPFPAVICASVNDVIVHGIPSAYRLRDGDLVSIDFGACVDGFHGDAAVSFVVGTASTDDLSLIATTQEALDAGIAAARPGGRLGDVSHAVGVIGRGAGYGIPEGFGGHGVGRRMHEEPHIPNGGRPGRGLKLRAGHVVAIEPWFWSGPGSTYSIDEDGWTLRSADRTRGAHAEHTVAITPEGPQILTLP